MLHSFIIFIETMPKIKIIRALQYAENAFQSFLFTYRKYIEFFRAEKRRRMLHL